jgi:hypothetical protein
MWLESDHTPFVTGDSSYVVARFENDLGAEMQRDFVLHPPSCGPGLGTAYLASLEKTDVLAYGPLELKEILFDSNAAIVSGDPSRVIPQVVHETAPEGYDLGPCVAGATQAYTADAVTVDWLNQLSGDMGFVASLCPNSPDPTDVLHFNSAIQTTLSQEGTANSRYLPLVYNFTASYGIWKHWYSVEFLPPPIAQSFDASWLGGEWHQDIVRLVGIDPLSEKGDFIFYENTPASWPSHQKLSVVERDAAYWDANAAAAQTLIDAGWEVLLQTSAVGEDGIRREHFETPVSASELALVPGVVHVAEAWNRLPAVIQQDFDVASLELTLDTNFVALHVPSAGGIVGKYPDSCHIYLPGNTLESEKYSAKSMLHEIGHCLICGSWCVAPAFEPYSQTVHSLFRPPYAGGPTCLPTVGCVSGYEAGSLNENLSWYVFGPERYRERITEDLECGSNVLLQKYEFWRDIFFDGVEFCGVGSNVYECTVDPSTYIP